jgi:hypothetical protein
MGVLCCLWLSSSAIKAFVDSNLLNLLIIRYLIQSHQFRCKDKKFYASPYIALSMPASFAKVESAAGMQDSFTEDEPSRGSNEFLIDHELKSRKGKTQRKSLFWTFSIILSAIGVIELIASATILLQLRSLHQPQIGSEMNHLIPRCKSRDFFFL